ncbi:MAG: hypothetical protein JSS63_15390, partial [Bacteroidetes bacterium]|nr:hypothetical protein [Bacteroidota bacterium]
MRNLKFKIALISLFLALGAYVFIPKEKFSTLEKFKNEDEKIPGFVPAEEWFTKQRAYPFEEIPNEKYIEAQDYVKRQMTQGNLDRAITWTLAGPINIEGRITCLAIHPQNPQMIFAGTANGGLWKSTNFCQSWVSVFDNQNTSSIGALAFSFSSPNIIYCGTGEANSLRSYYPGTGIYKSTDLG